MKREIQKKPRKPSMQKTPEVTPKAEMRELLYNSIADPNAAVNSAKSRKDIADRINDLERPVSYES